MKRILVALDGSQHATAALDLTLWFAERLGASVVGLHVVDIVSIEGSFLHDVSGSLGFEPYLDFSSKMRDALQERGHVILEMFGASPAPLHFRSAWSQMRSAIRFARPI